MAIFEYVDILLLSVHHFSALKRQTFLKTPGCFSFDDNDPSEPPHEEMVVSTSRNNTAIM